MTPKSKHYDQELASRKIVRRTQSAAQRLGGIFRTSLRGVPHVVLKINWRSASVCWMGKKKVWRIFYPYLNAFGDQKRYDCKNLTEVEEVLADLRAGRTPSSP